MLPESVTIRKAKNKTAFHCSYNNTKICIKTVFTFSRNDLRLRFIYKHVYVTLSYLNNVVLQHIISVFQRWMCPYGHLQWTWFVSGIAKGRGTLYKGMSLILFDVGLSTCGDGIRCKSICLNTTFGWNNVEVRVVRHLPVLVPNKGYSNDCHVRMFRHVPISF